MDPVSIGIGIAGGAVVGIIIGAAMGKGKSSEFEERIARLEKEKGKVQKQLSAGEGELDKAKKRAQELADALDKTKKSLKDAESAKKKHQEEAKKLEGRAKEAQAAAEKIESKAKQAEQSAKKLEEEAAKRSAEVDKLKTDLAKAGGDAAASFDAVAGDLNGILKVLCEHEGQEAAVIADANGIVVAAFGKNDVKDGMAAAATRITKIGEQLKGMVEFHRVSTFRISDTNNHIIAGRTFDVAGEMLALATVGGKMPSDGSLDGAMQQLSSALS